jgi:hypothetical protein
MKATHATLVLALAGGCIDDAPAAPTWREHVEPILRASCAHCHDAVGRGGAPPTFRLDTLEDVIDPVTFRYWRGAKTMAPFIAERAGVRGEMPPGGPALNDYQRGVLTNWAEGLALGDASKNHEPEITVDIEVVGDQLIVDYLITDADRDLVRGYLALDGLALTPLGGPLHAGKDQVVIDLGTVAPGQYTLKVRLYDDYSGEDADGQFGPDGVVRDGLAPIKVLHANTAPHVRVDQPFADQLFSSADGVDDSCAGPQCIIITPFECYGPDGEACSAPDGAEVYTVTIVAIPGAQVPGGPPAIELATNLPVTPGQVALIPWDPMLLAPGVNWHLRATISDGTDSRTAQSAPFIIGEGTTPLTFAQDIKPLIDRYCEPCHKSGGKHGTSFFTYEGEASDLRASAGAIYRRVVELELMPLRSGETLVDVPRPTRAERLQIGEWLLGGGQ